MSSKNNNKTNDNVDTKKLDANNNKPNDNSMASAEVNLSVSPDSSEVSADSKVDALNKTSVGDDNTKDVIDQFRNNNKNKNKSSKSDNNNSDSTRSKEVPHGGNSNNKNATKINTKNSTKTSENATSSVVSKTKTNTLSNFDSGLVRSGLETSGWIDRVDGNSIFDVINNTWDNLGVNSQIILNKRGEFLRQFKDWAQLQKARPNNSKNVFVLDDTNSDKSLSSETIFNNLYKQRRPFSALAYGTPRVNANVLPDIMQNLKILNFTTNSYSSNLDADAIFATRYGTLEQVLNTNNAYGDRSVNLNNDSIEHSVSPNIIQGYRVPSTNENGIGLRNLANNNTIARFSLNLAPTANRQLPGGLNMSVELNNKSKTISKMFQKIREEAANFASKQGSGDNLWFSPASLLANEDTLAATINGPADLKTFLWIVNDAILGAFKSQLIKAMKVGTPDSNYSALVERSTFIRTEYSTQFGKIWSKLKNYPMHKDVIDKWNQNKYWSKFKNTNVYDRDNPVLIPVFMVAKSGGFNYNNVQGETVVNGAGNVNALHPSNRELESLLTFTAQTLDRSRVMLPQGDWLSLFIQDVIGAMSLDSFVRTGRSNTKFPFAGEVMHTASLILNSNEIKSRSIQRWTDQLGDRNNDLTLVVPSNDITFGIDYNNSHNFLLPLTENYRDGKQKNNMIPTDYSKGKNVFGDLTISYHTMTGFMAAFVEMITSFTANGLINKWISLFETIDPYICRLSTLNPSESSFIFGTHINYLSLVDLPPMESQLPIYNRDQNIDFFYGTEPIAASRNFNYTPTRINYIDNDTYNLYQHEPYKLAGYRWTIINQDGLADRDITKDNTLCTIIGSGNTRNFWGAEITNHNVYLASHSVIRISHYMSFTFTTGSDNSMFPVYTGEHVGAMFFDNINVFINGGLHVPVGQLTARSLLVNSSDEMLYSSYPGFMDQIISSQLVYNLYKFVEDTNVLVPNTNYTTLQFITATTNDAILINRVIAQYNNNSNTMIIDRVIQDVFQRWDLSDSYIPITNFSNL